MKTLPNVGAKIIVHSMPINAIVESIINDKETDRTKINLSWADNGKSYVWLHDEGEVWFNLDAAN